MEKAIRLSLYYELLLTFSNARSARHIASSLWIDLLIMAPSTNSHC